MATIYSCSLFQQLFIFGLRGYFLLGGMVAVQWVSMHLDSLPSGCLGRVSPPEVGLLGWGGVSWPPRCCVPRCPEQGVLRHHPERTQLSLAARLSSSALLFPALAVPDALTPLSTVPLLPASRHPAMSPVGWASHAPLAPQAQ